MMKEERGGRAGDEGKVEERPEQREKKEEQKEEEKKKKEMMKENREGEGDQKDKVLFSFNF